MTPPVAVDEIGKLFEDMAAALQAGRNVAALLPSRTVGRTSRLQGSSRPRCDSKRKQRRVPGLGSEVSQRLASIRSTIGDPRSAPGWPKEPPPESAIVPHPSEAGWFDAAARVICTPVWVSHPQRARVICLSDATRVLLTAALLKRWKRVAPTERGRPWSGESLRLAVVTVRQLQDLGPRPRRAGFAEVFLASDLLGGSDLELLQAVGMARTGLHFVRPAAG